MQQKHINIILFLSIGVFAMALVIVTNGWERRWAERAIQPTPATPAASPPILPPAPPTAEPVQQKKPLPVAKHDADKAVQPAQAQKPETKSATAELAYEHRPENRKRPQQKSNNENPKYESGTSYTKGGITYRCDANYENCNPEKETKCEVGKMLDGNVCTSTGWVRYKPQAISTDFVFRHTSPTIYA